MYFLHESNYKCKLRFSWVLHPFRFPRCGGADVSSPGARTFQNLAHQLEQKAAVPTSMNYRRSSPLWIIRNPIRAAGG